MTENIIERAIQGVIALVILGVFITEVFPALFKAADTPLYLQTIVWIGLGLGLLSVIVWIIGPGGR